MISRLLISLCILAFANPREVSAREADSYFYGGARHYADGRLPEARRQIEAGLAEHPGDKRLAALLRKIEEANKKKQNANISAHVSSAERDALAKNQPPFLAWHAFTWKAFMASVSRIDQSNWRAGIQLNNQGGFLTLWGMSMHSLQFGETHTHADTLLNTTNTHTYTPHTCTHTQIHTQRQTYIQTDRQTDRIGSSRSGDPA